MAFDRDSNFSLILLFRFPHSSRLHETARHSTSVVDAVCSFLLDRQVHLREDLCLVWYEAVVSTRHNLKSEDVVHVRFGASGFLLLGFLGLFRLKFFLR